MTDRTERLSVTEYHSRADFESAMSNLSVAELVRLKRVGMRYSGGSGMSPDELLSEAYVRAATNSRNWPVGIDVVRFMAGAMRSIASGARDSLKGVAKSTPVFTGTGRMVAPDAEAIASQGGMVIEFIRPLPTPEQNLIDREEAEVDASRFTKWRQELLDLFDDDYQAQLIVEGMMDGLRGKELQELAGLTGTEFPTKYKKVSRRIEALSAERRHS